MSKPGRHQGPGISAGDILLTTDMTPGLKAARAWIRLRHGTLEPVDLDVKGKAQRIVYCRDSGRRQEHGHIQFDFLGYSFRPREAKSRRGKLFTSFLPAISTKAKTAIIAEVRDWHIHRMSHLELDDLARLFNAKIRGWVHYYGRYYPTALWRTFRGLNRRLVRWTRGKYKRYRISERRATHWLRQVSRQQRGLFAHWQIGIAP